MYARIRQILVTTLVAICIVIIGVALATATYMITNNEYLFIGVAIVFAFIEAVYVFQRYPSNLSR